MIKEIYSGFLVFAMCIMPLIAFAYLARAVSGPKFADRILAVNGIQTIIILIICILSVQGENYIVDIALIYAMLGFVTVIIVCKAYLRSHHKDRANDLNNLKGVLKDD
ncbi:MAG: sodium:proton antiporter [Oscillospiraceae bacterium]|nr:sodium:proton antiporter [Oscillospiraceae bacterium]